MNVIDIIIILFLLMGALVGFKQGVIKKLTSFVGVFAIIIVAFIFKNDLSVIFYENLPFFDFWGSIKGMQVLNILFYEILAFAFIFGLLYFIYRILLVITGVLETLLKMTVVLSIPSKILGIFVGIIEAYIYVFIILFILNLPVFNIDEIKESKYGNQILENTPLLGDFANDTVTLYSEVYEIIDNRNNKTNAELNEEVLKFMLDKKFITCDSAYTIISKNKITLNDKKFIEKYKEG